MKYNTACQLYFDAIHGNRLKEFNLSNTVILNKTIVLGRISGRKMLHILPEIFPQFFKGVCMTA